MPKQKWMMVIIIQGLFYVLSACSAKDSGWGETITRQIRQPDSILGVDSVVVPFMVNYHIPGLSLAVAKDGKLIYAKGYGYADLSTKEEVTKNSLFRIGQISQTITAIAVMRLIQEGRLSLEEKVFGENGILGKKYGTVPYASGITEITVNELLHHTCGGWSGRDDYINDPRFRDTSISREQLLNWTLENVPLRNKPGTQYGFSNFGYFVLGRVIEKVTGQSYFEFVKDSILRLTGISDMQLTGGFDNKKKNEVTNYKDLTFPQYNGELDEEFCFVRSDACSGWIASSKDLLKLIVRLNGSSADGHVLDSATMKIMLTSSKANEHFTCGWFLNNDFTNRYYISEDFGQSAEIVSAANGFSWSILVNASRPAAESYLGDLDNILWKAINNPATKWPHKDLF
jgi:D-alanyl-D-alanine carboxypeptidase